MTLDISTLSMKRSHFEDNKVGYGDFITLKSVTGSLMEESDFIMIEGKSVLTLTKYSVLTISNTTFRSTSDIMSRAIMS